MLWGATSASEGPHCTHEAEKRRKSWEWLPEIDNQLVALYREGNKPELSGEIAAPQYRTILCTNVSHLLVQVRQKYLEVGDNPNGLQAPDRLPEPYIIPSWMMELSWQTLKKNLKIFPSFYECVCQPQGELDPDAVENFSENLGLLK